MEEIIGRWTSDLEKYKAEFLSQAQEVKKWDSVLIENGDKLVNLLAETTEAEKTQARMDTVLQQLENEQEELGTALDYYESQIKDFFEIQFGSAEGMQPADQEREKTYRMAEQLNETLIGMEGDLGEMIKAINKAGATINKTSNADDPVSFCVCPLSIDGADCNSCLKLSRSSTTTLVLSNGLILIQLWSRRRSRRRRGRGMRGLAPARWGVRMISFLVNRTVGAC
jgi:hypothetical protein